MDLLTYISDPGRRSALADDLKCSSGYLWQVATGWRGRRASFGLAKRIEEKTGGLVPRQVVRPDIFDDPVSTPTGKVA